MFIFFFFFKQKTAYEMRISDWSSDVCSSDLRCPIELAYAVGFINEKAVRLGDQISPPMDGRFGADMISGQPLRNRHRDIIFTNIVRIEPSNGERFQSRMPDRRQIIAIEHAPFWQAASRNREAMGQDRTLGLFQRYPSKSHFELRKTVVISARMETAISAGPAAPIGSPAGPWMRASSLSVKPAAPSRSSRAACVFRDPNAPI